MERIKRFKESLIRSGVDSAIITSGVTQAYLTGFDFSDGYVVITPKGCYLVTDFRYVEAARNEAFDGVEVVLAEKGTFGTMKDIVLSENCKRLAFEEKNATFSQYEMLKNELFDIELVPIVSGLLSSMMALKDEDEIERIAEAQAITDRAFTHILSVIDRNMTEIDVAVELEYFMKKQGADGLAFDTIAVSGTASAMPHGVPRNKKLEDGFLTLDFGAMKGGYASDMTRTVVIGRADSEMKKMYSTVLSAQERALDVIKAGLECSFVDKIARDIINEAGYEGLFGHSLGHGVGRYIHEFPSLSPRSDAILEVGNVVTVEPGIYVEGKYGLRIEDMVAITENGIRNFTKSPKELIELF